MQKELALNNREKGVGIAILLLLIAFSCFTSNTLLLIAPLIVLFIMLIGVNWKAAYWILLFCVPASVELSFMNDALSTSLPDEPMMWLLFLAFLLMWARRPNMIPEWWWRNPIVMLIILQYLWMIVAVIYSKEPLLSVKYMLAKSWYLVSFFVLPLFVFREKKDFRKGFFIMLVPLMGTIIAILIRHAAYGFHFRKVEKAINPIFTNHVDYSTILSMFFCLVFVAVPLTKGKTWLVRGIMLFLALFFLPVIYLTFARAAYVAVVFAIGIAVLIRLRLVNIVIPVMYGLIALGMVYVTDNNHFLNFRPNYQKTFMHNKFQDHILATIQGRDMSSMERVYRWIAAVRMSKDEPVTGYGPNAFYYYYKPYAVSSFRTYVSRNEEHSTTHNYYLYMLVEQGWPAMLLYALFVMVFLAQAQKIYHRFGDRFYKYVTLGLIMMFAAGFINNFFSELLEGHKVGSLFYLGVALMVVLDKKSREPENQVKPLQEPAVKP